MKKRTIVLLLVAAFILSTVAGAVGIGIVKDVSARIRNEISNDINNKAQAFKISGAKHPTDTSSFIGLDKAKQIALDHAGLISSDVHFIKTKLDSDDGIMLYEIEFRFKGLHYEADIRADNGAILDWEVDRD